MTPVIRISGHAARRYAERAMGQAAIPDGAIEPLKQAIEARYGDAFRLAALMAPGQEANVRADGMTFCLRPDDSGEGMVLATVLPTRTRNRSGGFARPRFRGPYR